MCWRKVIIMGLKEERKFNDTESKRTRDKREEKITIEKNWVSL